MLVLALDTATPAVTAGVLQLAADGPPQVVAERVTVDARAHGELLVPSVQAVLRDAGARMSDLEAVVCGAGPGPFTGLRVGMVTAAALGDALSIPVHPVGSLDAIAHRAGTGSALLVATDARRREVYWARYDDSGIRVRGPYVCRPAEVPLDGVVRVAGAAAPALVAEAPEGMGSEVAGLEVVALGVVAPEYPDPTGLVAVAAAALRERRPPGPLTPLYLRRPDALEPGPPKPVLRV